MRGLHSTTAWHATTVALVMILAPPAFAQEDAAPAPLLTGVVKAVFLDPTTYAPAIVAWEATRLDWQSSQVFFQLGWTEHNAGFTASGLADDTAVGYAEGNRRIAVDALANLRLSLVHNFSSRLVERLLIRRYPARRTLVRTVGWIERIAFASYWTHRLSADHFRQWQDNGRRASQYGYQ